MHFIANIGYRIGPAPEIIDEKQMEEAEVHSAISGKLKMTVSACQ
jgi:hypothetical protein